MKPETEYQEGDLIEAVNGDTVIRGKAWNDCGGEVMIGSSYASTAELLRAGWTLTVLEKAAPPVPTEPGIYLDKDDDIWDVRRSSVITLDPVDAPFTRLEPVPVTVQKVVDVLTSYGWREGENTAIGLLRKHFGLDK